MRARQHFGCDVRVPCCRKARGTCGPCVLAQCTVKWLRSCGVYRCVLSMSSVSRRTSFYRTPVWASGRGSGGLRVRLALKVRGRRFSVHGVGHPPPGMHLPSPFLLRLRPHPGVSPASWIPRSPRLPETGNLAASEHADPDARSAVRVRRRFLACLGGGASGCGSERVLSEETIRPAPARCGPGPFRPVRLRFQDSTSGARAAAAGADGAV